MSTFDRVAKILTELSGCNEIIEDHSLTEDLLLDSLKMILLLIAIEDEFEIELHESDMNPYEMQTVADIVRLSEQYMAEKGGDCNAVGDAQR